LSTSFIASVFVILSFGRKLSFAAIYSFLRAHSIYLHPHPAVSTSQNTPSHIAGTSSPESFATIFITSCLVIVSRSLYSVGFADQSVIIPSAARKLAASRGVLVTYSSLAKTDQNIKIVTSTAVNILFIIM